jgi:hypothetical protein
MPLFQVDSGGESYLIIARNHNDALDVFESIMDEEMLEDIPDPSMSILGADEDLFFSDAWVDMNFIL